MAPQLKPLAPSESKAGLFERLGLDEGNVNHRNLYTAMKREARDGWHRITAAPDSLAPQFRIDSNVRPPYSFAQICETAIHREIVQIYEFAKRETRVIYDKAHDAQRGKEENWVIRWMLWHVSRYRDSRNKWKRSINSSDGDLPGPRGTSTSTTTEPNMSSTAAVSRYWDPVRDA